MFRSARIKLTAWYLLVIMLISISFSVAIYRGLTLELNRVGRMQRLRIEGRFPGRRSDFLGPFFLDQGLITETKNRLKIILAVINLTIFGASAAAGYFLAGRTLRPISDMVEEQGRFIADASHELRTPLTSLKSEIEVGLRDENLKLNEAKKLLASNLEEVNNLQTLSDGLIRLTHYQKEENGITVSKISLKTIIEEAVKKVAGLSKSKNIKIINQVGKITVEGDKSALVELFTIFLDNAIKYSPKKTEVRIKAGRTDGFVHIQIADQGVGIDKEDIPHLFDRFYRADKSRTKSGSSGYGLGLSIAKEIVERHNGSIKAESQINKGSVFTVQIPLKHSRRYLS